jgi:gamma-glutamyltranspeptidase/glutathione hydrolase
MMKPAGQNGLWNRMHRFLLLVCIVIAGLPGEAHAQATRSSPEAASAHTAKSKATAQQHMVSAANPLAVEAGLAMLRKGGSAVDAAIAVQLVLNLVEPQSSGIGGGAFLLHWDQQAKELKTYDGRETAPAAARPDRFLRNGRPIPFAQAVKSGLSIGVPGLVKLMAYAHKRHGRLPWAVLFAPAIELAEQGFAVSPRLNRLLWWQGAARFSPAARLYFFDSADPDRARARAIGYRLRNPAFARTLTAIRDGGAEAFYSGPLAAAIVQVTKNAPNFRGDLTLDDLAGYRVKERPPVCVTYRRHRICGMGPPSSGALTVAQTLKLAERYHLGEGPVAAMNPMALHYIAEAQKLAYADRARYMADPDFVTVPHGLLDQPYLTGRARLIQPARAMPPPPPGNPPGSLTMQFGTDGTLESKGTSHISIIDKNGNAVSMTTTIESAFGSGVWAAGFLLNNELTDFAFRPVDASGRTVANRVEAGKRPRSSMAPTVIFDPDGNVKAVLGSPGGSRIILYVTKAIVALVDWKLDPQAAADLRNFGSRGSGFELETGEAITFNSWWSLLQRKPSVWYGIQLRRLGHRIKSGLMTSGLHIVMRGPDGQLVGGADPRREGVARGD